MKIRIPSDLSLEELTDILAEQKLELEEFYEFWVCDEDQSPR